MKNKTIKGEIIMKKRFISIRLAVLKALAGGLALLALLAFALPMSAQANMASNTQITNAAQLSYNDGTGTQTVTSSVTVTVALIQVAPTIPTGTGGTTQYTGIDTQLNNTFTVVAQANGPDTYSLTPAVTGTSNETGATISLTSPASPVTLGASVVVADATHTNTTTTIYVPSDGSAADSVVNQIQANDWVVVGTNNAVQVQSVSDPGGSGIATIVLQSALSSGNPPAAGDLVREQVTVIVNVKSGSITATGTNIVITKHLTVASTTDATKTVTSADVTDTYTSGKATFEKYVRNVNTSIVGVTSVQYPAGSGPTYYKTGVTATTGQVLEYLIVVTNSGTASISSAVVTDGLPVAYSDFNTTPYSGSTAVTYYNASGTASYLTAASDSDAATWASPTLTVYVGAGATSSAGGTINASESVHVVYQVTVK
jgi:hypothetical protein